LSRSMAAARRLRAFMEESYQRTGDIKKAADEVSDFILKEAPDFFPREVMLVIAEQMVKCIAKGLSSEVTGYGK
jgi:hypothetical protein